EGRTCLLHYTDMNRQPWVSTRNPNGHLWIACLRRAIDKGFITRNELQHEIDSGHVRPSLLAEIESLNTPPMRLQALDHGFIPPSPQLRHSGAAFTRLNRLAVSTLEFLGIRKTG